MPVTSTSPYRLVAMSRRTVSFLPLIVPARRARITASACSLDIDNINGPTVIRVPPWVKRPLGRYYMYFAHHMGAFIRLAYADDDIPLGNGRFLMEPMVLARLIQYLQPQETDRAMVVAARNREKGSGTQPPESALVIETEAPAFARRQLSKHATVTRGIELVRG